MHHQDNSIPCFAIDDLILIRTIGRGGFGSVALYKHQGRRSDAADGLVVVKQLLECHITEQDMKRLKQEAMLLWQLKSERIINMVGILCSEKQLCIVMEFASNGSFFDFFRVFETFLQSREHRLKTWPVKCRIAKEVVEGMMFLHGQKPKNVLHLDLKSTNVLLDEKLHVKICDFGISQMHTLSMLSSGISVRLTSLSVMDPERNGKGTVGGTISHIAPEHLIDPNRRASEKSDTYSYGIFVWELLSNAVPYANAINKDALKQALGGRNFVRPDIEQIPEDAPLFLKKIMSDCWKEEPEERPTFFELHKKIDQNYQRLLPEVNQSELFVLHAHTLLNNNDGVVNNTPTAERENLVLQQSSDEGFESGITTTQLSQPQTDDGSRPTSVEEPDVEEPKLEEESITCPKEDYHLTLSKLETKFVKKSLANDMGVQITPKKLKNVTPVRVTAEKFNDPVDHICHRRKKFFAFAVVVILSVLITTSVLGGLFFSKPKDVECELHPITGGKLVCSGFHAIKVAVGDLCHMMCNPGFKLNGDSIERKCLSSGSWSNSTSKCLRVLKCTTLDHVSNGAMSCSNSGTEIRNRDTCTLSCDDGYTLIGSSVLTCTDDGSWSDHLPACSKVVPMCDVNPIIGGQLICNGFNAPKAKAGTTCHITCDSGYQLIGPPERKCLASGIWFESTSKCVRVCKSESVPSDLTTLDCTNGNLQGSCFVRCAGSRQPQGPTERTCLGTGEWSNPYPECKCPRCHYGLLCDKEFKYMDLYNQLKSLTDDKSPIQLSYGDRTITCESDVVIWLLKYDCTCRDSVNNWDGTCKDYLRRKTACRHAVSQLVRHHVTNGLYEAPCDLGSAPSECG